MLLSANYTSIGREKQTYVKHVVTGEPTVNMLADKDRKASRRLHGIAKEVEMQDEYLLRCCLPKKPDKTCEDPGKHTFHPGPHDCYDP